MLAKTIRNENAKPNTMPRFVILTHDHPYVHWDFFLEEGEVLRGWRLAEEPMVGKPIAAMEQCDHRKLYLDYEGPVSGDRGSVMRWDYGAYSLEPTTCESNRRAGRDYPEHFVLQITGTRLLGRVELQHIEEENWIWIFQPL
jgi:hypothetical protein